MKIAIFHSALDTIGGAEVLALTLASELNADVFTTNVDKEKIKQMGFSHVNVISIGIIPKESPFRQEMILYRFRKLNLKNKYDFYIIAGDWAMSGVVNNKPNLCYIHSPIREIFDLYKFTKYNIVPPYKRPIFDLWVKWKRLQIKYYASVADSIVCNSKNVQERIKKFLNRDSIIIHPPIYTNKYISDKPGDYWLSVNRLTKHKRIDYQMHAFRKMPDKKLIVVGCYENSNHFLQYVKYINELKPSNVTIVKDISFDELVKFYSECKGFITTAKDEDFGMTVIEAMSSGKPVVAPNDGGYKETILNGKTGILIDDINTDKLVEAVNTVEEDLKKDPFHYKEECIKQAKKFDTCVFIKKIKEVVNG